MFNLLPLVTVTATQELCSELQMPYFQPTLSANPRVSQMSHLSLICVETQEKWNQDAALKGISNIHIKRTEKKKHKKMKEALGGKKTDSLVAPEV